MKFDMTAPCDDCPFRRDGTGIPLTATRWRELRQALVAQQLTFSCHKTVDYDKLEEEDEDGNEVPHRAEATEQHCGGALIVLEKMEQPNQMMRWMERLHFYDRRKLDMTQDVGFGPHRKKVKA